MCGIVGLFLKNAELEARLGACLAPMLIGMSERGPDSAGFAVYRPPRGRLHGQAHAPSSGRALSLARACATISRRRSPRGSRPRCGRAIACSRATPRATRSARALAERHPEVRLMGIGETIEIYKEKGRPEAVAARFRLAELAGLARHRPHPHGDRERGHDRAFAPVLDRARPLPGAQRLAVQPQPAARSGCGATASSSRPTTTPRSRPAI